VVCLFRPAMCHRILKEKKN